jgi:NADH dehydrogenase FAD-containing subunit
VTKKLTLFRIRIDVVINQDVASWYPDLIPHIKLTLVEAGPGILGSFDQALSEYYLRELEKKNIDVRLNTAVAGVDERYIENEQVSIELYYTLKS